MATKKISALTSLAQDSIDPAADVLPINDTGSSETKKATAAAIVGKSIGALAATWNNALTTFKARVFNVTDTASAAASLLDDLQVGGVSKWSVRKDGELTVGVIPHDRLKNNSLGAFYSTSDQTGNVSTPTAFTFSNTSSWASGVSIASSSQITFANAGIYLCSFSIQFNNSDSSDHDATVWYRINGSDVTASASVLNVPKTGDGGKAVFELTFIEQLTAGQYIQVMWLPENVAVTADHTAAAAGPPAIPAIPSVLFYAHRIA
jgi:hypothetical protein